MMSILRRSVSSSIIISPKSNKLAPLTRFVSSSSGISVQYNNRPGNPRDSFPRDYCNTQLDAINSFNTLLSRGVPSISDYNFVLSSLARMGSSLAVICLFKQLEQSPHFNHRVVPNNDTWDILIQCHCRQGDMSSAISLFNKIIDSGHLTTSQALNDLVDGFCGRHEIDKAMLFYNDIILQNSFVFYSDIILQGHLILTNELCERGETQIAIKLLRHVLQIEREREEDYTLRCCYNSIIFRLSKDRLVDQAYDLCSEMIHVSNIKPNYPTYQNLIYGYCILSQIKQALGLLGEFEKSTNLISPSPHTLVTEQEVKSAKSAAAVMIKVGVKPNAACYQSVSRRLYKGISTSVVMNNIAQFVEELQFAKRYDLPMNKYD